MLPPSSDGMDLNSSRCPRPHRGSTFVFSFFPSNRGCDDTHPTDGVPVGPARGQADSNTGPQSPVGLSLATRSPGVGSQPSGAKYPRFCADSKGV